MKTKTNKFDRGIFEELGLKVKKSPCKLPRGWLGCFIALDADGYIDLKKCAIIKK